MDPVETTPTPWRLKANNPYLDVRHEKREASKKYAIDMLKAWGPHQNTLPLSIQWGNDEIGVAPEDDSLALGLACLADDVDLVRVVLDRRPDLTNTPTVLPVRINWAPLDPLNQSLQGDRVYQSLSPLSLSMASGSTEVRDFLLEHPLLNINALGSLPTPTPRALKLGAQTTVVARSFALPLKQELFRLAEVASTGQTPDFSLFDRLLAKGANPFLSDSGYQSESPFQETLDRLTRAPTPVVPSLHLTPHGGRDDTAMMLFHIQVMDRFLKALPSLGLSAFDSCLDPENKMDNPALPMPYRFGRTDLARLNPKQPEHEKLLNFIRSNDATFDPGVRLGKLSELFGDDKLGRDGDIVRQAVREACGLDLKTYPELMVGWLKKAGYGSDFLNRLIDESYPDVKKVLSPEENGLKPGVLESMSDEAVTQLLQTCQSELIARLRRRQENMTVEVSSVAPKPNPDKGPGW